MTIGERIREIRKKTGLTQDEFGKKIKIHARQLGKYEAGIGHPSLETLIKIAKFADVSIDYLISSEEKELAKRARIFDPELAVLTKQIDKLDKLQRDKIKWAVRALLDGEIAHEPDRIARSV